MWRTLLSDSVLTFDEFLWAVTRMQVDSLRCSPDPVGKEGGECSFCLC